MAYKVKITKKAVQDLENISDYLNDVFGNVVANDFRTKLLESIALLQDFPLIGSIQNNEREFRGFVVHRHTTIIYKFVNQRVIILRFYDNRQKPL
ncbi:MAG: type II toxin-antitoxin system RelE/ParE family toxin [Arcicella sp.]|jgi:plasmid stabilization system protein ParE|nr:type II toxin-antitoxin system RelE/ParE family toxin [Arcicella sp.]